MESILIILSLVVLLLWIASLCRVLLMTSKPAFLDDGGALRKRNVLLIIAHPDDESMFFSPTINYLTARGHSLHILCLSEGNADGIGDRRKLELYQACAVLKVQLQQVKTINHHDLQDGFGQVWNHSLLAKIIQAEIYSLDIDLIITFDEYGVSGHCNHKDVHCGIRKYFYDSSGSDSDTQVWELVSTNVLRKYTGPIDIWLSLLYSKGNTHCIINEDPRKSFRAMAQHSSQWVWFRKLFVTFSSYSYLNTLRKMEA